MTSYGQNVGLYNTGYDTYNTSQMSSKPHCPLILISKQHCPDLLCILLPFSAHASCVHHEPRRTHLLWCPCPPLLCFGNPPVQQLHVLQCSGCVEHSIFIRGGNNLTSTHKFHVSTIRFICPCSLEPHILLWGHSDSRLL